MKSKLLLILVLQACTGPRITFTGSGVGISGGFQIDPEPEAVESNNSENPALADAEKYVACVNLALPKYERAKLSPQKIAHDAVQSCEKDFKAYRQAIRDDIVAKFGEAAYITKAPEVDSAAAALKAKLKTALTEMLTAQRVSQTNAVKASPPKRGSL